MPGKLLTSDDLDLLGHESFRAEDPRGIVAELVAAVDEGRLADPDDDVYALSLAAEIFRNVGDLSDALVVAERAAGLAEARGPRFGHASALYGGLLMQSGQESDGLAVLSGLRGLMTRDENAIYYVSEALERAGHADVAVEWLTGALETALQRRAGVAGQRGSHAYEQAAVIAFGLAQARYRLRRELDLPHDEHDVLAVRLRDAADAVLADDKDGYEGFGGAVLAARGVRRAAGALARHGRRVRRHLG